MNQRSSTAHLATPTRRGVITAAAWSLPAVAVVSASPAYATSTAPRYQLAPSTPVGSAAPEVTRCEPVAAGTVTFGAVVDRSPAPAGSQVIISLPVGLDFVTGGRNVTVTTTVPGVVQVPAFVATGAAGTYTITASFNGVLASQSVTVLPAPGSVFELRRSTGSTSTTATFSTLAVGVTNAVAGAVQGDQTANSTGANGALLTDSGTVRIWGAVSGAAAASPATLTYAGATLTGITMLDTWTSAGSGTASIADSAGGVAAHSTGVWSWYRTGTGTSAPVVAKVTGLSGTVLAVTSEDGYSYALTTTGVHRWANVTSSNSTSPTVAATVLSGSTISGTSSLISTWSHRGPSTTTLRHGGAALTGRSVITWTGNATTAAVTTAVTTLPTAAGTPSRLISGDSGVMVLSTNGTLWSSGTGFGSTTWTQRATDVADFSLWSYNSYVGGLWITTAGAVQQFFGHSSFTTPVAVRTGNITTGTALSGITKVFASDGTYLALRNDGTVYAWGGNLDNTGRGPASSISTGAGTTVDLNVWGHHLGDVYYGGGYVIKGAKSC